MADEGFVCHILTLMHALLALALLPRPALLGNQTSREVDRRAKSKPFAPKARGRSKPRDRPGVVYLATAAPIEHAETELRLRLKKNPRPMPEPDPDYLEYLTRTARRISSSPITYPTLAGTERCRREQDGWKTNPSCAIGKKSYQHRRTLSAYALRSGLRLIFPRAVKAADKTVLFRLYLGGLNFPEREVEFRVKDLTYQGKLEM